MRITKRLAALPAWGLGLLFCFAMPATVFAAGNYGDLERLFTEWQAFEAPPLREGAPDYTAATTARRYEQLQALQARLAAIDPSGWPLEQRIDYDLVRSQLNGLEFDIRWLQPWARDPAFYQTVRTEQSDTPEHEGPVHHGLVELWQYSFPLSKADQAKLARELRVIPPLLVQARQNLTGNARDLWLTGTGTMQGQVADLEQLKTQTARDSAELRKAIDAATLATRDFVTWLESQAPAKNGPSGVGKEAYNWNLRNVHLVPMTWDDEVMLLKRELARAHASLKLEEERNRGLPQLVADSSAEEHARHANVAITKYLKWLDERQVLTVDDYLDATMRRHIDPYSPLEKRNFFAIASHHEPIALYAHFYHWFDHAWFEHKPNPSRIRREAWLYNVWDNRAEGMATAMEEIILHAGYYDDNPRAREVVWIMLAQRCARGLASLYAQANEFDLQQAKAFQVEWTPRGWMRPDLDLLGFEQQLYLRQPGYGTSYVTGKYLIEATLRDRAHQLGDAFTLKRFLEEFNGAGMMPVSLIHWQLTGVPLSTAGSPKP